MSLEEALLVVPLRSPKEHICESSQSKINSFSDLAAARKELLCDISSDFNKGMAEVVHSNCRDLRKISFR